MEELKYYLSKYKPGDVVTLSVMHNGEIKPVRFSLGEEVLNLNSKEDNDKNKDKP
jgi:hypothetical protein